MNHSQWIAALAVLCLAFSQPALAKDNKMGGGGGGGGRIGGGGMTGGGAHIPGSLGRGAMGGGAHLPSGMNRGGAGSGAHVPSNVAHAHVPSGISEGQKSGSISRASRAAPRRSPQRAAERRDVGRRDVGRREASRARPRTAAFETHPRDLARERGFAREHAHDFHTRDVHAFNDRERRRWRHGHWHNGWHDGRVGWFYDVDDVWYPYDEPEFPYPLVVSDLTVAPLDAPVTMPPAMAALALPATPGIQYHCRAPDGFYPDVAACRAGWESVVR
jgi:hypothetical protein